LYLVTVLNANRCSQLRNLQLYEEKLYSQNGEDGVLVALLDIIGVQSRFYVEFGVETGIECNSRILREHLGFQGLMMDGDNEDTTINLRKEFITESNIVSLFEKYRVPQSFDVLSVDVDMFDYWILARILGPLGGYRPRIILVETNPTLCLNKAITMRDFSRVNSLPLTVVHPNMTDQKTWDLSRYAGANPAAFHQLGRIFGYEMVYCERCGVNCFLVLRSELPDDCQQQDDWSIPFVPYPCFGTARTGGAYPGHEYDPLDRPAVQVTAELLSMITDPAGPRFAVDDVQAALTRCDANLTTSSWLIDQINAATAAARRATATDVIDLPVNLNRQGDPEGGQSLFLRVGLCDSNAALADHTAAFCHQHVPIGPNGGSSEHHECQQTIMSALLEEISSRTDDALLLCPAS
jgi:hypothetical protein